MATKDKKKAKASPSKKAGTPKAKPISKNPAASLALLHRARRRTG